jgi:hypothetical protein
MFTQAMNPRLRVAIEWVCWILALVLILRPSRWWFVPMFVPSILGLVELLQDSNRRAEFRREFWIRMVAPIGAALIVTAIWFLARQYQR